MASLLCLLLSIFSVKIISHSIFSNMKPTNVLLVLFKINLFSVAISLLIKHSLFAGFEEKFPELRSSDLFEGDLLLPYYNPVETKNAVILNEYKWPNATVLYAFTSNYTDEEKEKVRKNMDVLESNTCVKFIPYEYDNGNKTHILFNKKRNRGCSAVAGYRGAEINPIPVNFMAPDCFKSNGTIQHELLHVLGLLHEQARPDRDNYVKILWDNIDERHKTDFGKAPPSIVTTYGVPYDLNSVMHYSNFAFSKNGKPTLLAKKDPKLVFGQRNAATEGDLEKVRRMYNCN